MNNRNKKIIFSIIIVLIAIFGIVGVNALNKNLTSKVNTKDEVLLSDDKDSNISDNSNEQENDQKTKTKDEKQDSKAQDKKEENKSKEDKDKTVNEKANSKSKQDNNNKTNQQNKSEIKNEEAKSNANINKSKTTDNNTNNNKEIAKNQQINKKANTLENQSKKQTIELSIINEVNNRTLFCGQLPINGDENFNNIMNKFLSNNGVKHINRGGYISMMYGLSEFNAGPSSGWCYYVNGNKSSIGIEGYIPKNGDKVVWKYLKDGVNN